MILYTEQEIQGNNEILVREVKLFCMTFRFYVYKDSNGEYTNLALYKYNFGSETYEELNVYYLDMIDGEELDRLIKRDLKEYLMSSRIKKRIANYIRLPLTHKIEIGD